MNWVISPFLYIIFQMYNKQFLDSDSIMSVSTTHIKGEKNYSFFSSISAKQRNA